MYLLAIVGPLPAHRADSQCEVVRVFPSHERALSTVFLNALRASVPSGNYCRYHPGIRKMEKIYSHRAVSNPWVRSICELEQEGLMNQHQAELSLLFHLFYLYNILPVPTVLLCSVFESSFDEIPQGGSKMPSLILLWNF